MRKLLNKHYPIIILILVSIILFILNVTPGTFLTGWDNLHPEFNILLNLKRSFFGMWQSYRGLGLLDGQSNSANIVYYFFIGILKQLMPISYIRYVATSLLHLSGMVGCFYFIRILGQKKEFALFGALFYGLNIGIIQQFFAPFDSYIIHFAGLPFFGLSLFQYLQQPTKKNLIYYGLFLCLFSPMFFIPTLLLPTLLLLGSIWLFNLKKIRLIIISFLLFIIVNGFWLIPYSYDLKSKINTIENSRINQFSSSEAYLRNIHRGSIIDTLLMKGFMLDIPEFDSSQDSFIHFMGRWNTYSNTPLYLLGYGSFLICAFLGILQMYKKKKNRFVIILFGCSIFYLANASLFFSWGNELLRTLIPTLKEALRFPFTKFITLFALSFSISVSFGIQFIALRFKKQFMLGIFSIAILIISLPLFTGSMYSSVLKRSIPKDYFDLFTYTSQSQTIGRIALLPTHTYWSWQAKRWGYIGSGFEWFGIPQSLLVRAFDPWSMYNEQLYNELSYAMSSENLLLLDSVLLKYKITHVLIDQSISQNTNRKPINYDRLERLLKKSRTLILTKTFGKLKLYTVSPIINTNTLPTIQLKTQAYIDPAYIQSFDYISNNNQNNPDVIYPFTNISSIIPDENTIKINKEKKIASVSFQMPKQNTSKYNIIIPHIISYGQMIPVKVHISSEAAFLTTNSPQLSINKNKIIMPENTFILADSNLSKNITSIKINDQPNSFVNGDDCYLFSNYVNDITLMPQGITIQIDTRSINQSSKPTEIENQTIISLDINVPIHEFLKEHINIIKNYNYTPMITSQSFLPKSIFINTVDRISNQARVTARGTTVDLVVTVPELQHGSGYMIALEAFVEKGLPINFWLDNYFEDRAEYEMRLETDRKNHILLIPPTQEFYNGYSLHFETKSIEKSISQTLFKDIAIYPFPYRYINEIRLEKEQMNKTYKLYNNTVMEIAPFVFKAEDILNQKVVSNWQSYHKGWQAYIINTNNNIITNYFPWIFGGIKLKNHIKINNWANGWIINESYNLDNSQVVMIFWPQYLQFAGYIGLLVSFLLIVFWRQKRKNYTPVI